MKRRLISLFCAMALVLVLLPGPQAQALESNPLVRIGLYYGSGALPTANLQNATGYGSGYQVGYFNRDSGNQFVSLGEISQVELTIVKDKQIYISGDKVYSDVAPASFHTSILPYHLQVDRSFGSFAEASAFASGLNLQAFPAFSNGSYVVRVGQYSSSAEALADGGNVSAQVGGVSVCGMSNTCYTVTATGTNTILFEFDQNGMGLGIMPQGGDTQTWFKGYKYRGGFEYSRATGNDLTVTNVVLLNDYLKGVVPYEMSPSWPVEALKAQALCAKSYCIDNLNKHKSQGFDLCNTTDCQVYYGTNSASANSDRAVDETTGQYITYQGQIAQTYYHSSSGGHTEDVERIWSSAVPYLRGVEDTYLTNKIEWSASLDNNTVADILREKGYTVSGVSNVYISSVTPNGNVDGLTVERVGDTPLVFTKEKARTILSSPSRKISFLSHRYSLNGSGAGGGTGGGSFYVNDQAMGSLAGLTAIGKGGALGQVGSGQLRVMTGKGLVSAEGGTTAQAATTGGYQFKGTGNGHHIGMSQWGAHGMATAGFGYQDIIKFYFTGVQVGPA